MQVPSHLFADYEQSKLIKYNEIPESKIVKFKDLPSLSIDGVLKSNFYDENGELCQVYSDRPSHVGVIAATRLGKTTSYVIPIIISFAMQKVKKSLIISDPKGELYNLLAGLLEKVGYDLKLINFRDSLHSETWNPLTPIFRKYQASNRITDEIEIVEEGRILYNFFRGKVYKDQNELDLVLEAIKKNALDEVDNDISTIASMFVDAKKDDDPYWEDTARDLLKAFLWAMLEDSDDGIITEDTYSFNTIMNIMKAMPSISSGSSGYMDNGYFTKRSDNSRARSYIKAIVDNAPNTRSCIISSFNTKMQLFKEAAIRQITTCNSFDLEKMLEGDKPIAVFINYRDEVKNHYSLISLFVQNAYITLINKARSKYEGKLEVPFYFILDEFGNFPALTDFETVISACAGRNIFFILILQSYAQLSRVYTKGVSDIIKDNLNVHIFMGSNNIDTLIEFSKECGQFTRISPLSAINDSYSKDSIDNYTLETIPLVPVSRLAHFEEGECIITEANCGYTMFSFLERYYRIKEFENFPKKHYKDYVASVNVFDKKYDYTPKFTRNSRWDD